MTIISFISCNSTHPITHSIHYRVYSKKYGKLQQTVVSCFSQLLLLLLFLFLAVVVVVSLFAIIPYTLPAVPLLLFVYIVVISFVAFSLSAGIIFYICAKASLAAPPLAEDICSGAAFGCHQVNINTVLLTCCAAVFSLFSTVQLRSVCCLPRWHFYILT